MKNNNISKISRVYAKSLFETAVANNATNDVLQQFFQVVDAINSSKDLQIVMNNSSISNSKKSEIIEDIFSSKIDKYLLTFLKILVDKNRFDEIGNICESYNELLKSNLGQKNVKIVSAIELDDAARNKIIEKLKYKLNTEIIPDWEVDNEIIAGLVFKFDDYVIDSSIRTKIQSLSKIKGNL